LRRSREDDDHQLFEDATLHCVKNLRGLKRLSNTACLDPWNDSSECSPGHHKWPRYGVLSIVSRRISNVPSAAREGGERGSQVGVSGAHKKLREVKSEFRRATGYKCQAPIPFGFFVLCSQLSFQLNRCSSVGPSESVRAGGFNLEYDFTWRCQEVLIPPSGYS
jgi:hypothetical protein